MWTLSKETIECKSFTFPRDPLFSPITRSSNSMEHTTSAFVFPHKIHKRCPTTRWQVGYFSVKHHFFVLTQSAFSSRVVISSNHLCRSHSAVLCSIAVYKLQYLSEVAIMPINIRPVILELIVRLSGREVSHRQISKNTGVAFRYHLQSFTPCLRDQEKYTDAMRASIEDDHCERRTCPSSYHEGKQISLSVQNQGEADQVDWAMCLESAWPKYVC